MATERTSFRRLPGGVCAALVLLVAAGPLSGCTQSSAYSQAHQVLHLRYPPFPPRVLLRGMLYTDVVTPLTWNLHGAPSAPESSDSGSHLVSIPATRIQLSAEWSSKAIGDAMKKGGLACAFYADRRVFSILGGLYRKQSAVVWGTKEGCPAVAEKEFPPPQ